MAADTEQYDPQELLMQLRYLQNIYSQQYEALESDIATYTMANTALQRNLDLLQRAGSVENSNIIISGEGGAYIPARIGKIDKIMLYVGAGYIVEKSVPGAIEYLSDTKKNSDAFMNKLISDKQRIERELMDISFKMNALQAQQTQGQK